MTLIAWEKEPVKFGFLPCGQITMIWFKGAGHYDLNPVHFIKVIYTWIM